MSRAISDKTGSPSLRGKRGRKGICQVVPDEILLDDELTEILLARRDEAWNMQFLSACPLAFTSVHLPLVSWLRCPPKFIILCCQSSSLLSVLTALANSLSKGWSTFLRTKGGG